MSNRSYPPFTTLDSVKEFLFRFAAKGVVPYYWFNKNLPKVSQLTPASSPLKLEIVSHCWNYSEFLAYQLSSLVKYPINNAKVKLTVFYAKEDGATSELLSFFSQQQATNLEWNFVALPKEQLFRRAIGRNIAAKNTQADWVWFTDCDVVFHQGAIDNLTSTLQEQKALMVYPQEMLVTELLDKNDPLIKQSKNQLAVREVDMKKFSRKRFKRATGPIQIVHGDVARACGYCDDLPVYQKSMSRWSKCYDDRAFRWLINSQGTPIEVPNVLFIRHAEKGRYQKDSRISALRKANRKVRSALFNK